MATVRGIVGASTMILGVLAAGCGSGGTKPPAGCSAGTHADGSGACVDDPAYDIVKSQSAAQHWKGSASNAPAYELQFALTSADGANPAGTGFMKYSSGDVAKFTLAEGPDPAAIQITGGPNGLTQLTSISANGGHFTATEFSCTVTDSSGSPGASFSLVSGSLGGSMNAATAIAKGQTYPTNLIVDATNAYWTTQDGAIRSVPLGGGTVLTLASGFAAGSNFGFIGGPAQDDAKLYWTSSRTNPPDAGVYALTKNGGTVAAPIVSTTQFIDMNNPEPRFGSIVQGGNELYFSLGAPTQSIVTATTAGANPTAFKAPTDTPGAPFFAITSTTLYFVTTNGLQAMSRKDGSVMQMAAPGGNPSVPSPVAVDANNVYWSNGVNLTKTPINGGPSVVLVAAAAGRIVVDANSVYFTTTGRVSSVPISPPNAPTMATIVTSGNSVEGLAVDASHVYWADYMGGTIYSLPK